MNVLARRYSDALPGEFQMKASRKDKSHPSFRRLLTVTSAALILSAAYLLDGSTWSRTQAVTSSAKARLTDRISVNAAGRGNPWINMTDGHELLTSYEGAPDLVQLMMRDSARPLSLATADFDEDGMPDLIASYAGARGGIISLHRGNVDSVYPNTTAARQRKAEGRFSDVPFISPA